LSAILKNFEDEGSEFLMLPPTPDSVGSDQETHTPPYNNSFSPNTEKLRHLLNFLTIAVTEYQARLTAQVTDVSAKVASLTPPIGEANEIIKSLEGLVEAMNELVGGVLVVNEVMPVLFVAVVEAYLKDVLIFAAGVDASLMERTEQMVPYKNALNADSLEDLMLDFRSKWARKFVDSGGPTHWIESLEAMGARGYGSDTAAQMETLWGVRHLIIHSAAIANAEFIRWHPNLKAQRGKRFIVNNTQLKQWLAAMYDFVEITDRFFARRGDKIRKSIPSGDIPLKAVDN
jgi:hypothetical protein